MKKFDNATWMRIFPWIAIASDVPEDKLDSWLDELISEQPEIGVPLRTVLRSVRDFEDKDFLERPYRIVPESSRVGQKIGAYTIESLLGQGGMGEVWLAGRSDGRFKGSYAVKFLWLTSRGSAAARFRREGRLLARLTHPSIARLIDAGTTSDGQLYLILEYVKGEHIDVHCHANSLTLVPRLQLFLKVLSAVTHAHTNLIVHRDIKPSNVMVTADGDVKLLDFGIAKLVGNDLSDDEENLPTRFEDAALTPEYAAPEQILGEPPSTATDVYQLGLLLYLLLVERLPFATSGADRGARLRAALDDVPTRVSVVATGVLRKTLRGDLDAIVAKALRKKPAERYATAADLAADLQRYLDNEPVQARNGAFAYRAKKFIRRYRGPVIGSSMAAVALVVATTFALLQMHDAQMQRDQSRALQENAQAENQFLMQVMSTVSANGQPVTGSQILEKGMSLLDHRYADNPRFRADMFIRMAARFSDMDDQERAFDALLKAETIAKQIDDPRQLAIIECGVVGAKAAMGDADGAAHRLALGRTALQRIAAPPPDVRARCIDGEASLSGLRGDLLSAIKLEEQAVALVQDDPTNDELYTDLLSNVGFFYNEIGNPKKSIEVTQLSVDHLEHAGLGESENGLTARHDLAVELAASGQYAAALTQEELVMTRARSASPDGMTEPHRLLAFAGIQSLMGKPAEAIQTFDTALASAQHGKDRVIEALTRARRIDCLILLGRFGDAHNELSMIKQIGKGQEPVYFRALAHAQIAAAALALAEGKPTDARREIDSVIETLQKSPQASQVSLGLAYLTAARVANADGKQPDGEQRASQALAVYEKLAIDPASSADVGESLLQLARAQLQMGAKTKAATTARRAVIALSAGYGSEHTATHEAAALAGA